MSGYYVKGILKHSIGFLFILLIMLDFVITTKLCLMIMSEWISEHLICASAYIIVDGEKCHAYEEYIIWSTL